MRPLFPLGVALAIAVQTSSAFADHGAPVAKRGVHVVPHRGAQVALDRGELEAELVAILQQLNAIEQAVAAPAYRGPHAKHHDHRVKPPHRLYEVQKRVDHLQKKVYDLKYKVREAPVVIAEPVIAPMPPRQFSRLLGTLERENWDQSRLRIIRRTASSHWFTSHQAGRILRAFDFPHQKLNALQMLAPRLYESTNTYAIYQAFRFPPDRERARIIVDRAAIPQKRYTRVAYHRVR